MAQVYWPGLTRGDFHHGLLDDSAAWCDLDFRRYEDGKMEAEERLRQFPFEPSILVCSGGGYHVYWKFSEAQVPSD